MNAPTSAGPSPSPSPVQRIQLDVFAQLPREMEIRDRASEWARRRWQNPWLPCFLEGPALDDQGGLLMVDVAHGRILRLSASGQFDELLRYGGEPNGLALTAESTVLIADASRGLLRWSPSSPEREPSEFAAGVGGAPFIGLNDLTLRDDGAAYLTDQGDSGLDKMIGAVVVAYPTGEVQTILNGLPSPNGIALDPTSGDLLVAMTRDNSIWRGRLVDDSVQRVGRFVSFSGGIGPDGIATAVDGSLLVAHLGSGLVYSFDASGRTTAVFESPTGVLVTNVCIDHKTSLFYVTEAATNSVLVGDLSMVVS